MVISLTALITTIVCSVLWGVFDVIRKHLTQRAHLIAVLFYLSSGFSIFFLIWLLVNEIPSWNNSYILPGLLSVILNAAANFFYIKAIAVSPISSSVPFLAFTTLFTALTGYIFLGETLNAMQILGIVILVFGSFVVNGEIGKTKNKTLGSELKGLWNSFVNEKGPHLMILVSFCWALSAPFDKLAVQAMNVGSHGFIQSVFISFIYLGYLFFTKHTHFLSDFKKAPFSIGLGALTSCVALGLQFYAYQLMKVSVFESIKRAFALFTAVFLSVLIFKEKISKLKIFGIVLIISGGALILNG